MRNFALSLLSCLACLGTAKSGTKGLDTVPVLGEDRVPLVMYVNGGSGASAEEIEAELLGMADSGVSTIILTFYMTDFATSFPKSLSDISLRWSQLPEETRRKIVQKLHDRNTKLLLSAGGEAEGGKWRDHNANQYGITFCLRAKYLQFDGVDFDLESVVQSEALRLTEWLHQSAKSCREVFPGAILTSAPQSPYLDPAWGKGPFGNGFWDDMLLSGAEDGAVHNHMYTQYYNQGSYYRANSYDALFSGDGPFSISTLMKTYPNVPKDTFFIGKPFKTYDCSDTNDWVEYATLHEYVCKAKAELQWEGGLMFWQHHWGEPDQMEVYRTLSAPCTSNTTSTSTTPPRSTVTPKFLSTSQKISTSASTPNLSSSPSSSSSTGTTGKAPAVVADCQAGITASQPQWISDCQSKCALYGPGGLLEAKCEGHADTAAALIECVVEQADYCMAKNAPATSTSSRSTHATTRQAPTRVESTTEIQNSSSSPSHLQTSSSEHVTSTNSRTSYPTSTGTGSPVVSGCQAGISATQPQWLADCQQKCSEFGPGGELEAYCAARDSTAASLIECVVQLAPYCTEKGM